MLLRYKSMIKGSVGVTFQINRLSIEAETKRQLSIKDACLIGERFYSANEVCFSQHRMTMARTIKLYKVDAETNIQGLRPMTTTDVAQVTIFVNRHTINQDNSIG